MKIILEINKKDKNIETINLEEELKEINKEPIEYIKVSINDISNKYLIDNFLIRKKTNNLWIANCIYKDIEFKTYIIVKKAFNDKIIKQILSVLNTKILASELNINL